MSDHIIAFWHINPAKDGLDFCRDSKMPLACGESFVFFPMLMFNVIFPEVFP